MNPQHSGKSEIERTQKNRKHSDQNYNGQITFDKMIDYQKENNHFGKNQRITNEHRPKKVPGFLLKSMVAMRTIGIHFRQTEQKNIPF